MLGTKTRFANLHQIAKETNAKNIIITNNKNKEEEKNDLKTRQYKNPVNLSKYMYVQKMRCFASDYGLKRYVFDCVRHEDNKLMKNITQ